jgi:hypothetical protein
MTLASRFPPDEVFLEIQVKYEGDPVNALQPLCEKAEKIRDKCRNEPHKNLTYPANFGMKRARPTGIARLVP